MMKKYMSFFMVLIVMSLLVFSGCGAKSSNAGSGESAQASYDVAPSAAPTQDGSAEIGSLESMDRKVIRNGRIRLEVKDLNATVNEIFDMIEEYGGYIQSSTTRNNDREISSEITAKVPAPKFEEFFGRLKQMDRLVYDNISSEDVTEEYIDSQARLKVLKAQEERLISLMDKAERIEDLLRIENELSRLRSDIEQIQGRINYLDKATGFSTISISIIQRLVPGTGSIVDGIVYNLQDGWSAFFKMIVSGVQLIAWLSPFIILAVIIILFFKKSNKLTDLLTFWKKNKK